MPDYALTAAAEKDLSDIYTYSFAEFGVQQADLYAESLEETLTRLANYAELGRDVSYLGKGCCMYVHRRHSIYFRRIRSGFLVIRILGPGMVRETRLI